MKRIRLSRTFLRYCFNYCSACRNELNMTGALSEQTLRLKQTCIC
ncbi:hypothetical protein BFV94_1490 [Alteromonas macleodii]|nr:hypothetical protein BFV94_1490 [Alteromonas macleodii]